MGWFQTEGLPALKQELKQKNVAAVIINMGVNDCAATYQGNGGTRAGDYSSAINRLIEEYPSVRFYFCSLGHCLKETYSGRLNIELLNREIDIFNEEMSRLCRASYIRGGEYLLERGFESGDGIHYSPDTSRALFSYILNQIP